MVTQASIERERTGQMIGASEEWYKTQADMEQEQLRAEMEHERLRQMDPEERQHRKEVRERLRKQEKEKAAKQRGLAEFREQQLRKVLGRYERLPLSRLAELLRFKNSKQLEEWLLDLPEDTPLRIDEDHVVIKAGTTSAEIDQLVALIQQVEETPETRRAKKANDP